MTRLSCLIIDDEPLSQDVLKTFVEDTPMLHLSGICNDALEALDLLQEKKVDLLFLDINMPRLSGINMVRSMENPPMVIFTTAYAEYALEGFELDAVDYLLKPIAFDRFLKAVNKAIEMKQLSTMKREGTEENTSTDKDFILIRSDKKIYQVDKSRIVYIQSIGDYVKIITQEKTIIAAERLKYLEELLSEYCIRIHKSYLVAIRAIKYVEGNQVRVNDHMLPIGQKYRDGFFSRFT